MHSQNPETTHREHTAEHFRKELYFPKLLDRSYYQQWMDEGAKSMEQRCSARKDEILQTHQPEPVSEDLGRALVEIWDAARRELA